MSARHLYDTFTNVDEITRNQDAKRALAFTQHHRGRIINTAVGFVAPHDPNRREVVNQRLLTDTADEVANQATRWLLVRDEGSEPRTLKRWLATKGKDATVRWLYPNVSPRQIFEAIAVLREVEHPENRKSLRELAKGRVNFDTVLDVREVLDTYGNSERGVIPSTSNASIPRLTIPTGMTRGEYLELSDIITTEIAQFPPLEQELLTTMIHPQQQPVTIQEIADAHEVSLSTAQRRKRAALNRLKPTLKRWGW